MIIEWDSNLKHTSWGESDMFFRFQMMIMINRMKIVNWIIMEISCDHVIISALYALIQCEFKVAKRFLNNLSIPWSIIYSKNILYVFATFFFLRKCKMLLIKLITLRFKYIMKSGLKKDGMKKTARNRWSQHKVAPTLSTTSNRFLLKMAIANINHNEYGKVSKLDYHIVTTNLSKKNSNSNNDKLVP